MLYKSGWATSLSAGCAAAGVSAGLLRRAFCGLWPTVPCPEMPACSSPAPGVFLALLGSAVCCSLKLLISVLTCTWLGNGSCISSSTVPVDCLDAVFSARRIWHQPQPSGRKRAKCLKHNWRGEEYLPCLCWPGNRLKDSSLYSCCFCPAQVQRGSCSLTPPSPQLHSVEALFTTGPWESLMAIHCFYYIINCT